LERDLQLPEVPRPWESLFKVLADDPNFEHVMIDATIVRAHQHAAGAKGGFKMKPSVVRVAA
jgi:putative transposase